MKKSLLLWVIIAIAITARAADLVVEEYGQAPSYSSIQSAISAASSGDRIFIKNKAGNLPWLENITISQSLDLLAFQNDSFFVMQGTVTISPSSNSTINIIGMINLSAGIGSGSNPTGNRSTLRILNGQLAGDVNISNNNYNVIVQGTTTTGIYYKHGVIVGNTIGGNGITVNTENINPVDTSYIMGNKITSSNPLTWNSTSSYYDIRNNFAQSGASYGFNITTSVASGTGVNKIYNNTVSVNGGTSYAYAIYVVGNTNSQIDIQNNVVDKYNSSGYYDYGIYASAGSGGTLSATYNFVDAYFYYAIGGSLTVNLNNTTNYITLNGNGSTQANVGVDGGNPGVMFYDTDLSQNDAGCYGGSFTIKNFFPQSPNWAMTWLTNYNFSVRTGNTINIKASSYDK